MKGVITLPVIGASQGVQDSALVGQVLAHWPGDDCPPIVGIGVDELLADRKLLDGSGAVWVLLETTETPWFHELIGLLEEQQVSVMLTRPDEVGAAGSMLSEGIVLGPAECGPDRLGVILGGLWHQSGIIRELKTEVRMLRAHQQGLCDQIDKIDEELRVAAQLQREFLPRTLPSIRDVQFEVMYRPAGYVSGDIYDVRRIDEEHIGMFIADATGHGVPAALLSMYIIRSLHTKMIDSGLPGGYRIVPPDEALSRLNYDMVSRQWDKLRFATACYAVINCDTLELSLSRAGHPFPFVLHSDGSMETLEPEGQMLGVFADKRFELIRTRLAPGDRLLMYSDGFETAFPNPNGETEQSGAPVMGYTEEFRDLANGSLDEAMERLTHRLDVQTGSLNQRDDLTIVCLDVGKEQRAVGSGRNQARRVISQTESF